jgi:L-seryl-tRNA(Ser) seleniumtransferase
MAIPPWTIHYLKRSLDGVSEQLRRPESFHQLRQSAADLLGDLPETAARRLDRVLGQARSTLTQAQQWAQHRAAVQTPAINASGVLLHPDLDGQPLSDAALAAALQYAGAFSAAHGEAAERCQRQLRQGVSSAGCPLRSGTNDMVVSGNVEAGLAAIAAWARDSSRTILVPRCAAIGVGHGRALPELLEGGGACVREVGPSDRMRREDWHRVKLDGRPILVLAGLADPAELPPEAAEATVIRFFPIATLGPSPETLVPAVPTVAAALAEDVTDLVVIPGDGLVGGPRSGLLLGCQQTIAELTQTAVWPALEASPLTRLMLTATLRAEEEAKAPIAELLNTSIENLQHRAERLRQQIVGGEAEREASGRHGEVGDQPASIAGSHPYRVPSRQLRLRRDGETASAWAAALAQRFPAVLADPQDDTLVIDLRWVRPQDDATLVEALGGNDSATAAGATDAEGDA